MDTLHRTVLVIHTLIALLIIVLVLMQRGKGADAGAAFGAGSSGTVFGARGSGSFFSRMTAVFATLFFVSSLGLAYLSSQATRSPESILEDIAPASEENGDAVPALDDAAEALDDAEMPALDAAEDDAPEIPESGESE